MIGHVTFGANDLPRASAFYDALRYFRDLDGNQLSVFFMG
jgi:catechol 2,3-dioxygenase-like lactoylglutathione lyase family enzyme